MFISLRPVAHSVCFRQPRLLLTLCVALIFTACTRDTATTNDNTQGDTAVTTPQITTSSPSENPPDFSNVTSAEELYQTGLQAFESSDDARALAAFKRAAEINPDYADALMKLAATYAVTGNDEEAAKTYKKAVEAYEKALRKDEKNANAHFQIAIAYDKLGEEEKALKSFQQAAKLEPDNAEKQYELGLAYSRLARYKEAVETLTKATKLDPEDYRASDALEKTKRDHDRQQNQLKYLERIEEKKQGSPDQPARANKNQNANKNASNLNSKPEPKPSNTNR